MKYRLTVGKIHPEACFFPSQPSNGQATFHWQIRQYHLEGHERKWETVKQPELEVCYWPGTPITVAGLLKFQRVIYSRSGCICSSLLGVFITTQPWHLPKCTLISPLASFFPAGSLTEIGSIHLRSLPRTSDGTCDSQNHLRLNHHKEAAFQRKRKRKAKGFRRQKPGHRHRRHHNFHPYYHHHHRVLSQAPWAKKCTPQFSVHLYSLGIFRLRLRFFRSSWNVW